MQEFDNERDTEKMDVVEEPSYYTRKKKKKAQRKSYITIALVCAILGGFIGGSVTYFGFRNQLNSTGSSGSSSQSTIEINPTDDYGVVEAVADKVLPSVVGITTQVVQNTLMGPMLAQGEGSGFVYDEKGYIVTNAHVVDGANNNVVSVLFHDGTQVEGQVLWADTTLDLAVVKVEGKDNLTAVELGESSNLHIGEVAIAIGNPLGMAFQGSVTSGVISGLNRTLGNVKGTAGESNYMDGLIQTDASINSGNSGGPLLNKNGQVIGINTAKVSSGEGLGFSIPVDTVKPIVDQVIETGAYKTVNLGISGWDLASMKQRYRFNPGVEEGVVVMDVVDNSPASEAGLKQYDVITKIGEKEITGNSVLKKVLYDYQEGDTAQITFWRDEQEMTADVTFRQLLGNNV